MYDFIEFAAEYAPYTQVDMENICRAAELYKMGSVFKSDFQNRAFIMQKAVAAGFDAVLLADHKTAEEVEESIQYIRPDSERQGGRFGRPNRRFNINGSGFLETAEYISKLLDTVIIVMIEKPEAIDNLEKILAVPGLDMVQWGPGDYSLGREWERSKKIGELKEIEKYMIQTANKMGVASRCEIASADAAEYYLELGVKCFSLGDEVMNNIRWWNREGTRIRDIIGVKLPASTL